MSETQDVRDLAESVTALDNACRDLGSLDEVCQKFFKADSYDENGNHIGMQAVQEQDDLRLAGVDINREGDIRIVMLDADAEVGDPVKYHLAINQLEDSFPRTFDIVNELSEKCTDAGLGLGKFSWACRATLSGKPALLDAVQTYLKEGRRAYLEGRHEAEEIASDTFYEQQAEDYGLF